MKRLVIGALAHVDAGKTTLSEGMLYTCGTIRTLGRVDNRDAFLDTDEQDRARGITIFSKQAILEMHNQRVTLLDTPGHVDFSSEMERTLQVLDYAVLVISGADGVQGHTLTLWRLLKRYDIPVFVFMNKMDQPGTNPQALLREIQKELDAFCIPFSGVDIHDSEFMESVAMCDEEALEDYLETGNISLETICQLIGKRKLFPCYFGSALKMEGVDELVAGLEQYTQMPVYPEQMAGRVFKIARDTQGNRLTYLKVTGGHIPVRTIVDDSEDKIHQIRVYSGEKYQAVQEVEAGEICAVTGLTHTYPGQALGAEKESILPSLEPVLNYQIILPPDIEPGQALPSLRQLEEEEPQLHLQWNEELQEIQAMVMGEVQTEILEQLIRDRFGYAVHFGEGQIVYKETILNQVEGVGHFEPLRHYAEVHLILEPGERGSGMQYVLDCSEDVLSKNWQRLILTHLEERLHRGVLTGSVLTDVKITVASGRSHIKHTEGGDFRQATYRGVRQGLMQAQSALLEPYYTFELEVPTELVGRAMTDLDQRFAQFEGPWMEQDLARIKGTAPVATVCDYQKEVTAYSKGKGHIYCTVSGYNICHNTEEVLMQRQYDPEMDLSHPSSSVFCSHGTGFYVPWDQVFDYMHVESVLKATPPAQEDIQGNGYVPHVNKTEEVWLGTDEIDEILDRTYHSNRKEQFVPHKGIGYKKSHTKDAIPAISRTYQKQEKREEYLLVDGYNIIFAWKELSELAAHNIDSARGRLLDILCNYQGMKKCNLIVVFDAYRVKGHPTEIMDYHNIHVVYTKEAETADQYIEKFAHENGNKYQIMVATSDGLEQIIIRGQGCALISAREFEQEVARMDQIIQERIRENL